MTDSEPLRQRRSVRFSSSRRDSDDHVDSMPTSTSLPPFTPPSLSTQELLSAIPPHCFQRSALRSFGYVFADLLMIAGWMYCASFIDANVEGTFARWSAWGIYWLFVGWNFTGLWVLGHECGHHAFSTSKQLDNAVGLVLHSLLLVPYHSWRISHTKHHAANGHMDRDEVWVPKTRSGEVAPGPYKKRMVDGIELEQLLEDAPLFLLWETLTQQLVGWPAYLITNVRSNKTYVKSWRLNHFDPSSPIFEPKQRNQIILSDLSLLAVFSLLYFISTEIGGFIPLVKYYGIPYLLTNHWLIMVTYLQHTDPSLPHYRSSEWTFARGALATVDRNMLGPVGPWLMHGICETHIAHHISSKIPHYHAWDATTALREKLGPNYMYSNENMFVTLWKNMRLCRFVDDEPAIVFYRDAYGRPSRRVDYYSGSGSSDSAVDLKMDERDKVRN